MKPDVDAELHRLDRRIAAAMLGVATGPPPTALGTTQILAARGSVTARRRLGQSVLPDKPVFAVQPLPEDPQARPWSPPPVTPSRPYGAGGGLYAPASRSWSMRRVMVFRLTRHASAAVVTVNNCPGVVTGVSVSRAALVVGVRHPDKECGT